MSTAAAVMDIIPGLPDDVARECLIRVPYYDFSSFASVCKGWKGELEDAKFFQQRKVAGCSRVVAVMAQARFDPNHKPGVFKASGTPSYRVTLLEPETGAWRELPHVPGFPDGLPMFCQLARVGLNLVVLGGWHPVTWSASELVYVYDFLTDSWRRGADMPGGPRSFFGCGSDSERFVYVAGGHDDEKNALKSVMAYDVATDSWTFLPEMSRGRDECKLVVRGDKVHVVGGYPTEAQGQFEKSAEAFNLSTCVWEEAEENFLDTATCPRTFVHSTNGRLYMCRDGYLAVQVENGTWKPIAELPVDARNVAFVSTWKDSLLLIGSPRFGEAHNAYVLNSGNTWTKLEVPAEFSGHVQSGCCLEI